MTALVERREAVVREHMATEEARDFAGTVKTFGHPVTVARAFLRQVARR